MRTTGITLFAAVLLFIAVGISSVVSIGRYSDDAEWVEHSHQVLEQLETTLRLAIDARRDAVAYVATGDPRRLEAFDRARRELEVAAARVADVTADNPRQAARIRSLRAGLAQESAELTRVIAVRNSNPAAALAELQTAEWLGRFQRLQSAIDEIKGEERGLLSLRNRREEASVARAKAIVVAGDVLAFALVMVALAISARRARQRQESDRRLAALNQELTSRVTDLQRRSTELSLLTRLGEQLQSCETREESAAVIRQVLPQLFPGSRGGVFTIAASRNLVVPVATWPDDREPPPPFTPSDCWALRRGAVHEVTRGGVNVVCMHTANETFERALCLPMLAHGEALGLLHVEWPEGGEGSHELAVAVSEQLGLAQANLDLQETLRRQAMRDPLTGVFNRRYMEETLAREIHRAMRQHSTVSVLLLDLDHFKEYNDTFGHFAGDDVLRNAAGIMQRGVRAEDVVCRYGGDEFVIIMPDAEFAAVDGRARFLIDQLGQLLHAEVAPDRRIAVSIGIAAYPADANDPRELLQAADRALYRAKRGGRGRLARAADSPIT